MAYWTIETGEGGYMGWGRADYKYVPLPYAAWRTCVFKSRREARDLLKKVKGPASAGLYPNARVQKVRIVIRPC